MIKKIEEFLAIYFPTDMEQLHKSLIKILGLFQNSDSVSSEIRNQLFQECLGTAINYFCDKYGNNIAQYIGQIISINGGYREVGIRMAQLLWHSPQAAKKDSPSLNSLRNLLRSLPFAKNPDQLTEELILNTFPATATDLIKDMDLASQGRVELMPEFEIALGSVRSSWLWLSVNMGIMPSNKMFGNFS
jgi:hypothetical protein